MDKVIITEGGTALLTALIAHEDTAEFVRIDISNHDYSGLSDISSVSEISDVQQSVNDITVLSDDTSRVTIKGLVDNSNAEYEYYARCAGIIAKNDEGEEILYAIAIWEEPVSISPASITSSSNLILQFDIYVGNAEHVTVNVNEDGVATMKDVYELNAKIENYKPPLATPSELGGISVNANYNPTDSSSAATVNARNPRQTFTVNNQLYAEGYSTGTGTTAGITKLYTETGENTDGTMTQAAIADALSGKVNTGHSHTQLKSGDYTVSLAVAGLPDSIKSLFSSDSSICLGWSQYKWGQIYSTASTISTSDRNRKHNISYIGETSVYSDTALTDEKLEQLVMGIKPTVYKFDDGTSNRPHHGIISQDFEQLLQALDIDHAAFIKSPKMVQRCDTEGNPVTDENGNVIWDKVEGEYEYGFRYEELILDILRFAQLQKKRADSLEERIENIETKLAQLWNR